MFKSCAHAPFAIMRFLPSPSISSQFIYHDMHGMHLTNIDETLASDNSKHPKNEQTHWNVGKSQACFQEKRKH
eukprot:1339448-Amphidinium_carterae.1